MADQPMSGEFMIQEEQKGQHNHHNNLEQDVMSSDRGGYQDFDMGLDGHPSNGEANSLVLVIDDEPINCFVISALLGENGV